MADNCEELKNVKPECIKSIRLIVGGTYGLLGLAIGVIGHHFWIKRKKRK